MGKDEPSAARPSHPSHAIPTNGGMDSCRSCLRELPAVRLDDLPGAETPEGVQDEERATNHAVADRAPRRRGSPSTTDSAEDAASDAGSSDHRRWASTRSGCRAGPERPQGEEASKSEWYQSFHFLLTPFVLTT